MSFKWYLGRAAAHRQPAETADWDELIYRAVVRKESEAGLADSAANRVTPADDVLREVGLKD